MDLEGSFLKKAACHLGHKLASWGLCIPLHMQQVLSFAELATLWPSSRGILRTQKQTALLKHLQLLLTFSSYLSCALIEKAPERVLVICFVSPLLSFFHAPRPSHLCLSVLSQGAERTRRPCDHLPPVLWQPHRQRLWRQHAQSLVSHHRKGKKKHIRLIQVTCWSLIKHIKGDCCAYSQP